MIELLMVVGFMGVLAGLGALALVAMETLVLVGGGMIVLGLLVGVPTGVMWHVRLYQVLSPLGRLEPGWLWSPIGYNEQLPEENRREVLAWCYVGGLGFGVFLLGAVVAGAGIIRAILQSRGIG
jgi:hypothetical protein